MLEIKFTSQFKKDIKLAKKQGKNMDLLFEVIEKLATQVPLEEKFKNHTLGGQYSHCGECHIEPDWLLIYSTRAEVLTLILYRIGSHSDLF